MAALMDGHSHRTRSNPLRLCRNERRVEKTIEDIESYVKAQSNAKTIQLTQNIKPSLIGGLTIEFGGKIYDNTVSNQLRKIKKELQLA